MSQSTLLNPYNRVEVRRRNYRTLSLVCEDEPLSDVQLKSYQSKLQQYRSFLESVNRLALCGNVCLTEEAVTIGEHGLLTGESLNALQHAGAISVYNTLQQNNWEFPIAEDCEVAVIKTHIPVADEFLDSEKPVRSDWPAVHISECFVEAERAKLHGSVRPLRTIMPPTVIFRNVADIEEDVPEPELSIPSATTISCDGSVELISSSTGGISVKKVKKDGREVELIPLEEYYFGRQDGSTEYFEDKGDFRFKCAVCQRMFYSNFKLMSHILSHVDEVSQSALELDSNQCRICNIDFNSPFDHRAHVDHVHTVIQGDSCHPVSQPMQHQHRKTIISTSGQLVTELITQDVPPIVTTSEAALNCRICGKETASELALAHHLQSTHRQREMPYVCRLCLFRSSLYEDILDHFKKAHNNSNHLLCIYCLRIFTPSDAHTPTYPGGPTSPAVAAGGVGQTQVYLQHLRMHQVRHQVRRCPTCKLNFTNKSDYQVHRRLDHKASRSGDRQVLSAPGTMNESSDTNSAVRLRSDVTTSNAPPVITSIDEYELLDLDDRPPAREAASELTARLLVSRQTMHGQQPKVTLMNAPEASRMKSLTGLRLPSNVENLSCLECSGPLGSIEHKHYMPCSLCRFATYCSVAYGRHLESQHLSTSGQTTGEPDTGTPMVHAVAFQWAASETRKLPEPVEQPAELVNTSTVDLDSSVAMEASQSDSANSQHVSGTLPDVAVMETSQAQKDNIAVEEPRSETDATEEQGQAPNNTHEQKDSQTALVVGMETDSAVGPSELPNAVFHDSVEQQAKALADYMSMHVAACSYFCQNCGATGLNGNQLARHLVETCGVDMATLHPSNVAGHGEGQRKRDGTISTLETEMDVLFPTGFAVQPQAAEATATTSVVAPQDSAASVATANTASGDVVSMETGQPATYGVMVSQPGEAGDEMSGATGGTQLISRVGEDGTTTIDVTDATGQVLQQFILPEDLQLEEGQTLVMIQGEDGQPQLAIVNQEDLIDPSGGELMLQPEGQANNMILYCQGDESQNTQREEEKENQHYLI